MRQVYGIAANHQDIGHPLRQLWVVAEQRPDAKGEQHLLAVDLTHGRKEGEVERAARKGAGTALPPEQRQEAISTLGRFFWTHSRGLIPRARLKALLRAKGVEYPT